MANIELYINETLIDTGKSFSVRLNRQLINPAELNTKDAQYSYSISLPPTANNHKVLGFANVEEVKGKFDKIYRAELIINSVRIFIGNFRLSEITQSGYKGNLYLPAPKSIKDIFGDINLNQLPEYRIPFKDVASSITAINTAALTKPQMAIFPYVLYGLLPKVPIDKNSNNFSARDIWDDSVRINMQEIPPSLNPLLMLKHIFNSQGFELVGTAFNDARLTQLYQSYRNPPSYTQPWNYGHHAKIELSGRWSTRWNERAGGIDHFERGVIQTNDRGFNIYGVNIFDCTNVRVNVTQDPGGNVLYREVNDTAGTTWAQTQIRIPASGYYKVRLTTALNVVGNEFWHAIDNYTGVQHISGNSYLYFNHLGYRVYEVKLLRDRKSRDFGLSSGKLDGGFYGRNQNQGFDFNIIPKYFPQVPKTGQLNFIDPVQNDKYLLGFTYGSTDGMSQTSPPVPRPDGTDYFLNPLDLEFSFVQMNAAKPGLSWSSTESNSTRLGIKSPGYMRWYRPTDTPDGEGSRSNKALGWGASDKHKIDMINAPDNYVYRNGLWLGNGSVSAVVWLEAGELITLATLAEEGSLQEHMNPIRIRGWTNYAFDFSLSIEPFRTDEDWLKVDSQGRGTAVMNWNDPVNFDVDSINLMGFLPSDIKVNDYIDNFIKAYNLKLTQISPKVFSLDVKQNKKAATTLSVDLDSLTSVKDRTNTPLGLPSKYKLGFTINTDEEGYFLTKDDGGGEYSTGSVEDTITEQKSNFSYNWFKNITKVQEKRKFTLQLPVICKHEAWTGEISYKESMVKRYTDLPIRFWYLNGLLPGDFSLNGKPISFAKVSNSSLQGDSVLNYKNTSNTILSNYFMLLGMGGENHYTKVEAFLTPQQYNNLDGSYMVKFNGDLYYAAEVEGYDPTNKNKTKLKLIRKI